MKEHPPHGSGPRMGHSCHSTLLNVPDGCSRSKVSALSAIVDETGQPPPDSQSVTMNPLCSLASINCQTEGEFLSMVKSKADDMWGKCREDKSVLHTLAAL